MNGILAFKLVLTPLLVLVCMLVTRRWGAFVGGVAAGLPVVSGPLSFFLTLEQGVTFSAHASYSTLLGIDANALAAVAYPWLAVHGAPWYLAIALSLGIYFLGGWIMQFFPYWPWAVFAVSLLAPMLVLWSLPRQRMPETVSRPRSHWWFIALQMAFGSLLVYVVTEIAHWLGAGWSGVLMFFPVMICAMVPFIHATQGAWAVVRIYRGLMAGWFGCIAFTAIVMALVEHTPLWFCYVLATVAALGASAIVSLIQKRIKAT
ncbi:MAG: hypothetical protein PHI96_06485 [Desulfovibrio sp.]|nr:hypothetical protein [Desulfovibrio sp.]